MNFNKITFTILSFLFVTSLSQAQLYTPGGNVLASGNTTTNIGIGKVAPTATLDMVQSTNPSLRIGNNQGAWTQIGVATCNGCFAQVAKANDVVFRAQGGGDLLLGVPYGTPNGRAIRFLTASTVAMTIFDNERVGIGTEDIPAAYKLAVADGIITEKVKVAVESTGNWSDYVFEDDYELPSLEEVDAFIQENNHLPGVPSADEVVESGLDLGQMDATLLKKIEELTLYVIELKKENDELSRQLKDLSK